MDRAVARLNIEHYRRLLATETDETKRQTIIRLLAEEKAKLAALDDPPEKNGVARPFPPARRVHVDPRFGFGVDPATENAAAWKRKSMRTVVIDDGQLRGHGRTARSISGADPCAEFAPPDVSGP
jgi:hypothetical protein